MFGYIGVQNIEFEIEYSQAGQQVEVDENVTDIDCYLTE